MDLATIEVQHLAFENFLNENSTNEHIREMDIDDLSGFLNAAIVWNTSNPTNQIIKIGVFNTLRDVEGIGLVNSYLVGLDSDGVLVKGGGGAGVPGPPHCCP
jgi:hypothetical protein